MKPSGILNGFVKGIITLSLLQSTAWADPAEVLSREIIRTSTTGAILDSSLSKNVYRQEAFEEEYAEEVPYEEQETYYEDVPYQVEETYTEQVPYEDTEYYTDYEEYYENEYKCETVGERECSDRQVCHDVPDRRCHTERVCETVGERECTDVPVCRNEQVCRTVPDRHCSQERVCKPVPGENRCEMVTECGTNARGERICKERKVCHQEPGREDCGYVEKCEDRSRQECSSQQVCENKRECREVPRQRCGDVQRCEDTSRRECSMERECREVPRERCGYVQVRKTRPVQRSRTVVRYREEQRSRIVTRYRQEARTRTVTKYRTEIKCCRTAYRDVFDYQHNVKVQVLLPQQAVLIGNEKEQFQLDWTNAGIVLKVVNSIFGYRIINQQEQGDTIIFELGLTAKYTPEQVGENSIQSVRLLMKPNGNALAIADDGALPRVESKMDFVIKSAGDGALLAKGTHSTKDSSKIMIPIAEALPQDRDLDIELKVERSSLLLEKPVSFIKKGKHLFDRLNADHFGVSTLKNLQVVERGNDLVASFFDEGADSRIQTAYELEFIHFRSGQVIFSKSVKAEEVLDASKRAFIMIPGKDLIDNDKYSLSLVVKRESRLLDRPVSFNKKANFERKIDEAEFLGDDKISGLVLKGIGSELSLVFSDLAPKHPAVEQSYAVKIVSRSGFLGLGKKVIAQGSVLREKIEENRERQLKIKALQDLSSENELLEKYAKENKSLMVDLIVTRKGPRLNGGKPVVIKKQMALKVTK